MKFVTIGLCLLALSASGCVVKAGACTEIGCTDQATISIQNAHDGSPTLVFSLGIDAQPLECVAPSRNASTTCSTKVRIASRELQACVEETVGYDKVLRCSGTGRFEQVIEISGTPSVIGVTVRDGAAVIGERTFQAQYSGVRPNGPHCEPVCMQWGQTWNLP